MGYIKGPEARKLLNDPELMDEVVNSIVQDQSVMTDLADDIADELSDVIEDDPTFKQKILQAALATPEFKQRIVMALVDDMS